MWTRKELKKDARTAMKSNYWRSVLVCLILAFFAGAYSISLGGEAAATATGSARSVNLQGSSNTQVVNALIANLGDNSLPDDLPPSQTSAGIAANLFNNITRSGSFVFGILNGINQIIFGDQVMAAVIILIGAVILFLYWMFVGNLLRIGECRFFLESSSYHESRVDRLLYLYRIRRVWNPAKIMFLRTARLVLWAFTLIGWPIKYYAYHLVPYITAENPDIPAREAFALSSLMMRGNKWRVFLLDASFWGWRLLNTLTLGLLDWLYVNPYQAGTNAELYLRLRQTVPEVAHWLNDPYLICPPDMPNVEYPVNLYPIPEHIGKGWFSSDYKTTYPLQNLVLMFFTFCMGGWVWEVLVDLLNTGHFVNRGTMYGPWLPIYGCGGVLVIVLFRRFAARPVLLLGLVTAFCGIMEFGTSWVLEELTGQKWWDYSGYFLNIQGRVCFEGLVVFALGGCLAIYAIGPSLNNLFNRLPKKLKLTLCLVLSAAFLVDLGFSIVNPNTAATDPDIQAAEAAAMQVGG